MHYCRHCQKPTATNNGPCPHCGKELSAEAENLVAGLATIDLDTSERRVDPATGEVLPAASPSTRNVELEQGGTDIAIELGFDPMANRTRKAPPVARPSSQEYQGGSQEEGARAPRPAPAANMTAGESSDVERVAGFGAPPASIVNTLGYMLHVRKRRSILRSEIASIDKERQEAGEKLDQLLLEVGNSKLEELSDDPEPYGGEVEDINKARIQIDAFRSERAIEEQDMKGKESYVDEEITRLQLEAEKFKSEQDVLNSESEEAYASRKRIQLRLQRVDIEIRNIREQIPVPSKGQPSPDPAIVMPLESKIQGLEEVKKHIKSELETADEGIKEINRKLAIARNQVAEQMGKIALTNKKKSDLLNARKASDEISQGKFYQLQGDLEGRIRNLARKSLRDDSLPPSHQSLKRTIEEKIASQAAIEAKQELYKKAIDSYSKQDYMKGHVMLGGIAFLSFVLLLLVLAIIF